MTPREKAARRAFEIEEKLESETLTAQKRNILERELGTICDNIAEGCYSNDPDDGINWSDCPGIYTVPKANHVEFEAVKYKGEYALIYDGRRNRSTVPDGFFMYDIRHADEDWDKPSTIEKSVTVNFYGSIILGHTLYIPECGYLNIAEGDISWLGYCATLADTWGDIEPIMEQKM